MNLIFSIMALIGGLSCCVGDILFDLKGKGNKKLGTSKNIDSNWSKISEWRFGLSIIFAMFGVILLGFGLYAIGDIVRENNEILSNIILITGFIGCTGGLFVHSMLCVQAVIYKRITDNGKTNFEFADNTLEGFYKTIIFPFILVYSVFMIADICIAIAILNGALGVPRWMALLNSIVFLFIGLAMIGVIGMVAILLQN